MKYLLDTCVVSETIKVSPNSNVIEFLNTLDDNFTYVSVITLGEIKNGIQHLPLNHKRTQLLIKWFASIQEDFEKNTISITPQIAVTWGMLTAKQKQLGRPISTPDALIAATAQYHKMTLVTRNISDFEPTGISLKNPF